MIQHAHGPDTRVDDSKRSERPGSPEIPAYTIAAARCYVEVRLRFPAGYPGSLAAVREKIRERFGFVATPALVNLLDGTTVVLRGELSHLPSRAHQKRLDAFAGK